ncbi:MAG: large-conductance mechanosensitive channel protein MscL, partial [Oscillospiraceae bacterium]
KAFAIKGNVIDMAVGVVIGAAFGKITSSLVNDIIMPAISLITGKVNFADLAWTFQSLQEGAAPIVVKYGMFIQNVFDFFIIAFSIFIFVKFMGKLRKKESTKPPEPVPPTKEEILLTEIRDLLKEQNNK